MAINFVYDLEDIPAKNMKFSFKMIFMKLMKLFIFKTKCQG